MTARQPRPVLQLNSWNRTHRGVRAAVFLFAIPFFFSSLRSLPPHPPPPLLPLISLFSLALPSGREKSRSHDFGKEESSMCLIGYAVIEISPKFPISIAFLRIWKHPSWQRTSSEYLPYPRIFPSALARHRRILPPTMSILFAATTLLRGDSVVCPASVIDDRQSRVSAIDEARRNYFII